MNNQMLSKNEYSDSSQESKGSNECTKDSFSYRFCDDLTEVVLKFLPIDHKIKLSCVSKQFQRCLQTFWRHQRVLIISHQMIMRCIDNRNNYSDLLTHPSNGHQIDIKKFVKVLKCFKNINEIYFEDNDIRNSFEVFEMIFEYCSQLKSLQFNFDEISSDQLKDFNIKFGLQIQSLEINGDQHLINGVQKYPNLVSIVNYNLRDLFSGQTVFVRNLKKALIHSIVIRNETDLFDIFVANNSDLIHLGLDLEGFERNINYMLEKVSNLQKLRKLELRINTKFGRSLTKIDINLTKKCQLLTHLTLDCNLIGDHFFIGFDILFPHLKYLKIEVRYQMTDKALESISKIRLLEYLSFNSFNVSTKISDSGVESLIDGCKRLRRLEFNLDTDISCSAVEMCRKESKIEMSFKRKGLSFPLVDCGVKYELDFL